MPECVVCGSTDFGDPRDGLFFCLECGTQSQDVRVEVSQVDDGGGFTRTLKQRKEISKKKGRVVVASPDSHALETFQRVMKRQCDALIALGFDPSVKEAARLIWFTYLKHYGYAFRDQSQATQSPGTSSTTTSIGSTSCKPGLLDEQSQPHDSPSTSSRQKSVRPTPSSSQSRLTGEAASTLSGGSGRGAKGGKRRRRDSGTPSAKRVKPNSNDVLAGFDTFPNDDFLFESKCDSSQAKGETGGDREAGRVKIDPSKSVRIMEGISSWEELAALERTMDCKQLLMFRQAYLSAGNLRPKFVGQGQQWLQPRVFKPHMTISLVYLALLYTEQTVLPVDIVRWVRLEKIPLSTPIEEKSFFRNEDNLQIFFHTSVLTTASVVEQSWKLYQHLPLPAMPSPDPHAVSHAIIDRLRLTDCFKGLVDKALDAVYLPIGYAHRYRMDAECAAVIIMMLRILYGLDDHVEMDHSVYCDAVMKPAREGVGEDDTPTAANSLLVWVDWVQLYCNHLTTTMKEGIPFNSQELGKVKNYQSYFQFCRDTVFTKGRPVPPRLKSYRSSDPAFSKRVAEIFSSSGQQSPKSVHKPLPPSDPPSPRFPTPSTTAGAGEASSNFPRLVPLSFFLRSPKAPCISYRPLPLYYLTRQDRSDSQLSHAMRFLLSAVCQLIDISLPSLYATLLQVEKTFTKGMAAVLKNLTYDLLLEMK